MKSLFLLQAALNGGEKNKRKRVARLKHGKAAHWVSSETDFHRVRRLTEDEVNQR
jgi:hypothetical protein